MYRIRPLFPLLWVFSNKFQNKTTWIVGVEGEHNDQLYDNFLTTFKLMFQRNGL